MRDDLETFENSTRSSVDPLLRQQREDVARMRASLLSCSGDPSSTVTALKNITVLRVIHQVSRIVRYLEMMDKIEDKLYSSIDAAMDRMDESNPGTWMMLLRIQEQLQKSMIESHKLLQPYLNIQELGVLDLTIGSAQTSMASDMLLSQESRDKVRMSAQQVLAALNSDASFSENIVESGDIS